MLQDYFQKDDRACSGGGYSPLLAFQESKVLRRKDGLSSVQFCKPCHTWPGSSKLAVSPIKLATTTAIFSGTPTRMATLANSSAGADRFSNDGPEESGGKAKGLVYGSGPTTDTDGRVGDRRGWRALYFREINGHLLEVMTA